MAIAALPLWLSGCQAGFFGAVNLARDGGATLDQAGLIYAPTQQLRLDIYRPASAASDAPVLLFYYGGSWRNGQRQWYRFVGDAFARLGAITVIADYRTFPEAPFPVFMSDAAAAVAWVQGHRAQLRSDGPLILAGHSAGAHIAALLATDPSYLQAAGVDPGVLSGVIGLAGPYDFLPIRSREVREVFVDAAGAAAAQPVSHVSAASPPFLLIHGLADDTVWPRNSESLARSLREHGVAAEVQWLPAVTHVGLLFALGKDDALGMQLDQMITQWLDGRRVQP
ncbi:MAG: alpha/beta hydrolase [Xanthomonadales bacterium]|nr:alpha/beta hydrolase [Xanthomonadales bacterium]